MSHLIAPSLLSADFSNLKKDLEVVNVSKADWFHLGYYGWTYFVPNISFGYFQKSNQSKDTLSKKH